MLHRFLFLGSTARPAAITSGALLAFRLLARCDTPRSTYSRSMCGSCLSVLVWVRVFEVGLHLCGWCGGPN